MRAPWAPTPEEIVQHVIASARLEGQTLDAETIDICRRIANGEMSQGDVRAWQRARVVEIQARSRDRQ